MKEFIDIVFDRQAETFVEVENNQGASISIGEWIKRPDGYHVLRIPIPIKDRLELQSEEFTTLDQLTLAYRALPAVVDDGYPEARDKYELYLHRFLKAAAANGRMR